MPRPTCQTAEVPKTTCQTAEVQGTTGGADVATIAGQYSCTSLISRAFPHLWPRGAEISFCLTIDHCRTILYYTVQLLDLALRRRYCRLFTLLFRPGSLTGLQTLTFKTGVD